MAFIRSLPLFQLSKVFQTGYWKVRHIWKAFAVIIILFPGTLGYPADCVPICYDDPDHYCMSLSPDKATCVDCAIICMLDTNWEDCQQHCRQSQFFPSTSGPPTTGLMPSKSELTNAPSSTTITGAPSIPVPITDNPSNGQGIHVGQRVWLSVLVALIMLFSILIVCSLVYPKFLGRTKRPVPAPDTFELQEGQSRGTVQDQRHQTARPKNINQQVTQPSEDSKVFEVDKGPVPSRKALKRGTAEPYVENPVFHPIQDAGCNKMVPCPNSNPWPVAKIDWEDQSSLGGSDIATSEL